MKRILKWAAALYVAQMIFGLAAGAILAATSGDRLEELAAAWAWLL